MSALMQILGGIFFLLNKIFLYFAERSEIKGQYKKWGWRTWSWIMYLIGMPFWIIIFIWERNWIMAALEASGIPSMLLGLMLSVNQNRKESKSLQFLVIIGTGLGLGYSLYDFDGITTITQVLELTVAISFLIGTYLIAKKKSFGYICYIIMHLACSILMYMESYPWIVLQQIVSLGFIIGAYRTKKNSKEKRSYVT